MLPNNNLQCTVAPADYRFISLGKELSSTNAARLRIHAQVSHKYVSTLGQVDSDFAESLGCNSCLGSSVIGEYKNETTRTMSTVVDPSKAMANV